MYIEKRILKNGEKRYKAVCRGCKPKRSKTYEKLKDAKNWLASERKRHKDNDKADLRPITVQDAYEEWYPVKSEDVQASQALRIKQHFNNILPILGGKILAEITDMDFISLRKKLQSRPTKATGRPLANRTIKHMETCFKGFLNDKTGHTASHRLTHNPLAHVKTISVPQTGTKKADIFSESEQELLILSAWKYAEKEEFRVWYMRPYLGLNTGARSGELAALKIKDFDFERRMLTIERSAYKPSGTTIPKIKGTKTEKPRVIALTDHDIIEVKAHIKWMERYWRWYVKKPLTEDQFILFDPRDLGPIHFGATESRWKTMLKEAGLRHRGFHSLRHTHATMLLADGEGIDKVADRLGHESTEITFKFYRTFIKTDHDRTRETMARRQVKR